MITLTGFNSAGDRPISLTIGNFDGVHLGHQAMFASLIENAKACVPSVMTFDPHPKCVFQPCQNFLLTDTETRIQLIEKAGIEQCWMMPFNDKLRTQSPKAFIENLRRINVQRLTVGQDFRFGYKGVGDVALLREYFDVTLIDTQFDADGKRISSSLIRDALREGDFTKANTLLGREFCYTGKVIHGQKLGRTLNFPTANLSIDDARLMPSGVFAVTIKIGEKIHRGVANCGRRPTVGEFTDRLLEVFVFDFKEEIYGKVVTVTPHKKIRDEQKFDGIDSLKSQISQDIQHARDYFSLN